MALKLAAERAEIDADGEDVVTLTVSAVDSQGRAVPTADVLVDFKVTGEGALIGVGNGDPNCQESDKEPRRSLFSGLAQVIVQSTKTAGTIEIMAEVTVRHVTHCAGKDRDHNKAGAAAAFGVRHWSVVSGRWLLPGGRGGWCSVDGLQRHLQGLKEIGGALRLEVPRGERLENLIERDVDRGQVLKRRKLKRLPGARALNINARAPVKVAELRAAHGGRLALEPVTLDESALLVLACARSLIVAKLHSLIPHPHTPLPDFSHKVLKRGRLRRGIAVMSLD